MIAGLKNLQVITDHAVDESVLLGDPPRPGTDEPVLQLLRLTDALLGDRQASAMSLLIRFTTARSAVCQMQVVLPRLR